MFGMLKNKLSKLIKMITNKKFLVVLAVLAVIGGGFLFMKSRKMDTDIDVAVADMVESNMRANINVESETKELSQAPQAMPSVEENLAMIE